MDGFSRTNEEDTESDDEEEEDRLPRIAKDEEERAIVNGDEPVNPDDEEEALIVVEGPSLNKTPRKIKVRRMSSPIGMRGGSVGPGGGRRLSNGLGQSNVGHGTGGTSFS